VEEAKVEANESLRRTQAELGLADGDALPFLCECVDTSCRALVRMRATEYDRVRRGGARCIVVNGHPFRGDVVGRGEGYLIVEGED
jgi:hypothetical protein